MIFEEKEVHCKDGRSCILRSAGISDAPGLSRYLKETAAETPYLMREPEEITLTQEDEERFIKNMQETKRELLLFAIVDGVHVGNASLMLLGNYKRYAHRCSVAIALYKKYWGLGIGRQMLKEILQVAKECGYEQAELEVVCTNEHAIALYQSLGFEIYATQHHSMKYKDGTYADEYLMMKQL